MMTWNLQRAEGLQWTARLERVRAMLAADPPDMLCVQEALPPQVADLSRMLPGHHVVAGVEASRRERNVIFVDARRYDIEEHGGLWLSETPHKPHSRSWGNEQARAATWARVRARDTGAAMTVVNVHLDHESEPFRLAAARFLDERFPGAVLAGDFNSEPDSRVHDILTASRRDPHPDAGAESMNGQEPGPPDARYDWILVPYDVEVTAPRALRWDPPERSPSDHDALAAEVSPRRVDEPAEGER